jgi:hypothetical protein
MSDPALLIVVLYPMTADNSSYFCMTNPISMNTKIFKNIGAVIAGLIFIVITHTVTDLIMESTGVLPKGNLHVGTGLILFVIFYRAVLSLLGCYLTAKLAPDSPLKHALILGGIGVALSTVGAIATAEMNLGPAWYAWSLVVSLLVAWLGGKLYLMRNINQSAPAK